ncbi:Major facilitator superfamily domain general substrate transporter [Penicillium brevicompactum]|uniref:Major facilitator superfamily domain general substrate transporter n=1 Tax=Penicillium brevicompactum TaxID=5074 RepID=UPI00253FE9FA|nr:Major facilitator superfamily domain general substrate transporter [Penicillium brevicompactum]KAJ5333857.1 Major facilitator superfamily domain general substrate transporter [Penicillium brevicompactum]
MGVSSFMSKMKPTAAESQVSSQTATPARADSTSVEKDNLTLDDSPVKYLTWRSFILGLCVSMGGFIFGYSTGQISGFTTMPDFKERFAEKTATGEYAFSNVRNGLIVGLGIVADLHGPSPLDGPKHGEAGAGEHQHHDNTAEIREE